MTIPKTPAPAILYTDAVILKTMLARIESGEQPVGMLAVGGRTEGSEPLFCHEEVARLLDKQLETVAKFLETYSVMATAGNASAMQSPGANYAQALRAGLHLTGLPQPLVKPTH